MTKFKTGDRVRIVNYGHLLWVNKKVYHSRKMKLKIIYDNDIVYWCDIAPEKIGNEFVVGVMNESKTGYQMLNEDGTFAWAWAEESQLELVVND